LTDLAAPITRGRELRPWPENRPLRDWQKEALGALSEHDGTSFLASATPAAGKTTFGLRVAWEMLRAGRVSRVVVAGPTTHICRQWAADAARYGIDLEPNRPNSEGSEPRDRHGVAVTYQTISAGPKVHAQAARRPTLLIADEPHHMGEDASWGRTAQQAFGGAVLRLLLSGTPFRSDNAAIPWVDYDEEGVSSADYVYGYSQALVDEVCRPITFLPYDGEMEWRSDGRLRTASFDLVLPQAESARRLRTALDANGDWMGEVLRDADKRLSHVRADGHPDAGGLVIASDQEHARAIAARLQALCGEMPEIVMSDEPEASARIGAFSAGTRRWLVSVLMVSEGVDIPRLRVGVYATAARTELFFRQVVGRFIRRTPTPEPARQMSYLLLPADMRLKTLAFAIEEERRHALDLTPRDTGDPAELDEIEEEQERKPKGEGFESLSSTGATLDEAILSETTMQLFSFEEPKPHAALEAFGGVQAPISAIPSAVPAAAGVPENETAYEMRERLRDERAKLVAQLSRKTGESHRDIHARINRKTGVKSVGAATKEQLEKGNTLLQRDISR
jgi:superfamily II DNA or RNA helicase